MRRSPVPGARPAGTPHPGAVEDPCRGERAVGEPDRRDVPPVRDGDDPAAGDLEPRRVGEQSSGERGEGAPVDDAVAQVPERQDARRAAGVDGEAVEGATGDAAGQAGLLAPPAPGPLVGVGAGIVDDEDAPVVPTGRREMGGEAEPGGTAADDDRVEDVVTHGLIRRPAGGTRPGTEVSGRAPAVRARCGQAAWSGCRTTLV